jgi:hypothetical protein
MSSLPEQAHKLHPVIRLFGASFDPRTLPLVTRLTHSAVISHLDATVYNTAIMLAFSGLLMISYLVAVSSDIGVLGHLFPAYLLLVIAGPVGLLVLIIVPPLVTISASILPISDTQADTFPILELTMIPAEAIRQSYRLAALYRSRGVLMWSLSIIPVMAAGMTFWSFVFTSALLRPIYFSSSRAMQTSGDRMVAILYPLIFWLVILTVMWGVNIIGLRLGVDLGMKKRLLIPPTAGAALAVGLPYVFSILMIVALTIWPFGDFFFFADSGYWVVLGSCGLVISLPYLIILGTLKLLNRHQEDAPLQAG